MGRREASFSMFDQASFSHIDVDFLCCENDTKEQYVKLLKNA